MKIPCGIAIILAGIVFSCNISKDSDEIQGSEDRETEHSQAKIVFDTIVNDLGILKEGEQVIAWFDYHNEGDAFLVIEDIEAGCGCTIPEWNREPLGPGKEESLKVIFNSSGKKGLQSIEIVVISNAVNPRVELKLNSIVQSYIN